MIENNQVFVSLATINNDNIFLLAIGYHDPVENANKTPLNKVFVTKGFVTKTPFDWKMYCILCVVYVPYQSLLGLISFLNR